MGRGDRLHGRDRFSLRYIAHRDCTITIPDTVTIMGYGVKVARDADHYVIEIDSGR